MAEKSTSISALGEEPSNFIDMEQNKRNEENTGDQTKQQVFSIQTERIQASFIQHGDRKDGVFLESSEKAYNARLTHPLRSTNNPVLSDSHEPSRGL
jgi:hypothetical protein